jgi:hypothetical protein
MCIRSFRLAAKFAIFGLMTIGWSALDAGKSGPGWPGLLVERPNYSIRFEKPVIGEKADIYQQKAMYDWNGGRIDQLDVTLVRDPAIKIKYSAETMKKEKVQPSGQAINGKQTWHWIADPTATPREAVTSKLVVVLSDDKAMILEQKYHTEDLPKLVKIFDFAKIEKALANPPQR